MKLKDLLEKAEYEKVPPEKCRCSRCGIVGNKKDFVENRFNKGNFLCKRCDEHVNSDIIGK